MKKYITAKDATTLTNDHQCTIQEPHNIPEYTLETLDSYLNNM